MIDSVPSQHTSQHPVTMMVDDELVQEMHPTDDNLNCTFAYSQDVSTERACVQSMPVEQSVHNHISDEQIEKYLMNVLLGRIS
ncbi:hypothetical protein KIN20_034192 [Parelaphostrongylus tenuis]|uniref:Uncharacterized protein n=1 Tax=Parelaphostrongylus tenuis TaxID=148309 RepID=A0AAD5R9A1_PARTN|nr:hypothetical protein KIN20_034192 [Parelaphostrongylus tenuis]